MVWVNLMNNLWVQNAIPFLLLVLGLFSSPVFAETEQRCEAYVQSSLLQHRENLANVCYFTGSRWHADALGQKKWCLGVNEQSLRAETAERSRWLAVCKIRNQKQGRPYHPVKKSCLPKSFKQVNVTALRQCISANKSSISGNQGGVDYLSYLHAFGEEYYLFNFTGKDSNLRLKTHYIGNKKAYCAEQSVFNVSFSLVKKERGIAIAQKCSSEYQLEDGTIVSPDPDYRSSKVVAFELMSGVWRPTSDYFHFYFFSSFSSHSADGETLHDWVSNSYFSDSSEDRTIDGWSSGSVESGRLLTKSTKLSIASFYPRAINILKFKPSEKESCYRSDRREELNVDCTLVAKLRERLKNKMSR